MLCYSGFSKGTECCVTAGLANKVTQSVVLQLGLANKGAQSVVLQWV